MVLDELHVSSMRCNTVPIEKGTETQSAGIGRRHSTSLGCNTVPIEKGTETKNDEAA